MLFNNIRNIENMVLFLDINTKFSKNLLKALVSISDSSNFYIISNELPSVIFPSNCSFIDLNDFLKNFNLQKNIDTENSIAIAVHATDYAIELECFNFLKKLVIFTGDDTLFNRSRNQVLTKRFNNIFATVNAIGFCSFFHQQEYIKFLKQPALLMPYGYQTKEVIPFDDDFIKMDLRKTYHLDPFLYNVTIIPSQNILGVVKQLEEMEANLENFNLNNKINYNVVCKKAYKLALENALEQSDVLVSFRCFEEEDTHELKDCLKLSDLTISFDTIYSVYSVINIFVEKHHPLLTQFVREYSDFENLGTHIFNYETIEGLAKKTISLLFYDNKLFHKTEQAYERYIQTHSLSSLQEKLKVRIEQIFANNLHPNHEDTDFIVDDGKPLIVFSHFAQIESHRHSARLMRVRAMRDNFRKVGRCFTLMGSNDITLKKLEYLNYLVSKNIPITLVYEESLSAPASLDSPKSTARVSLRRLITNNNLPYYVFFRDIYQAYPVYETLVKDQALQRFKVLREEAVDMMKCAHKMYTPSEGFIDEMFVRGMLPQTDKRILDVLPPAINSASDILNGKYISGSNNIIKIVYSGGMGEFYDFSNFLKAMNLCKVLPIEFHLYIKRSELERSRHIYGYELDNASNIKIHTGSLTELAINMQFDLGMSLFDNDEYRKMAVPVKVFDYASLNLPQIVGVNNEACKIVTQYDIGFSLENSVEEIVKFLLKISKDRRILQSKQANIEKFRSENCWEDRVATVLKDAK